MTLKLIITKFIYKSHIDSKPRVKDDIDWQTDQSTPIKTDNFDKLKSLSTL